MRALMQCLKAGPNDGNAMLLAKSVCRGVALLSVFIYWLLFVSWREARDDQRKERS